MAVPANWSMVRVYGQLTDDDNDPLTGYTLRTVSSAPRLQDTVSNRVMVPEENVITPGADGSFFWDQLSDTDTDVKPTGRQTKVELRNGSTVVQTWWVSVDHTKAVQTRFDANGLVVTSGGTQLDAVKLTSLEDFSAAPVAGGQSVGAAIAALKAESDPFTQYATNDELTAVDGKTADVQPVVVLNTAIGDGVAVDTAAINAKLAGAPARSVVRGVPGKTYLIDGPLRLRAGGQQTLDMTGCRIVLKAGSNCNVLQNHAVQVARRVLDAVTVAGSTSITSATAAFVSGDVGKRVRIENAAGGAVHDTTIASVTNSTTAILTAAPASAVTGEYMAIGDRDRDIAVIGGTWDRQANNSTPSNSPDSHSLRFRHVDGLTIRDLTHYATGGKYAVNPGDCTNIRCVGLNFPQTSSDGIHLNGPCSQVQISDVIGDAMGDDIVSLTARDTFAIITDCAGDITDLTIENLLYRSLYGNLNSSTLKVVAGQNTTQTTKYKVARLFARNLKGPCQTQAVVHVGDVFGGVGGNGGHFEDITIDGVRSLGGSAGSRATVNLNIGTMDRITLRDVISHPDDLYAVSVGGTVDRLVVDGVRWDPAAAYSYMLPIFGSVARLMVRGVQAKLSATATAGSQRVLWLAANATVGRAILDGIQLDAPNNGALVAAADATATLGALHMANLHISGIGYPLGDYRGNVALSAANVWATGMTKWFVARGAAQVTVAGMVGLNGNATGYDMLDTAAVLVIPPGGSGIGGDPNLLAVGDETVPRLGVTSAIALTSGSMQLTYFTARKTEPVTQLLSLTGTASATPTLARIGVYEVAKSGDLTLVASIVNDTTLWASAFSSFTRALAATWSKVAGRRYAIGLLYVGTTGPQIRGLFPVSGGEDAKEPRLNGTVTGLTDLPATVLNNGTISNGGGASHYAVALP